MAVSLRPSVPLLPLALALLLLLLLTATTPRLSSGGAFPNVLIVSAQYVNAAAAHDTVPAARRLRSFNVLLFQTSMDLRCLGIRIISPPPLHNPPVRVVIAYPTENGTYPVILFKHGFLLANCYYTKLFESIASSGFIVVAPQAMTCDSNCRVEIEETAKVANWVSKSLAVVLNAAVSSLDVVPDMSKLVMAGHSRGGKIAFALVLGMASTDVPSFSALITLDPVDSRKYDSEVDVPAIVASGCNHTRNQMSVPVLILGAGYGSDGGFLCMPACAPACCSHMAYFNCSSAPTMYQFVASKYGHFDFLDDLWLPISGLCKSGGSKALLQDFSADLIVAFLESALEEKKEGMEDMVKNWKSASITLEEPQVNHAPLMNMERKHNIFQTVLHEPHTEL